MSPRSYFLKDEDISAIMAAAQIRHLDEYGQMTWNERGKLVKQRVEAVWQRLGKEQGFVWSTAQPKYNHPACREFYAEPLQ